jgi:hypothetical protein
MANQATVAITGNTYPVKDQLKALGARWNPDQKAWMIAADKADAARKIVSGTPQQAKNGKPHFAKCHECGAPSRGYYRCYDCSLEYRDGGSRANGGMSYYDRNGRFVLGDDD